MAITLKPYVPSPTLAKFHASGAFFRGIRGPFGSGKSVACIMELLSRACEIPPYNGKRRSRFAVIRATYSELLSTSLKTWEDWIPASICPVTRSPPITGRLNVRLGDGTSLEMEVLFIAVDKPEDAEKLRSLELTGAWLNEASELDRSTLDIVSARVGRFPPRAECPNGWSGIVADTNPPDETHWWYDLAEVSKPDGYRFFVQPPAVIRCPPKKDGDPPTYLLNNGSHGLPPAENLSNLHPEYYQRQWPGKSEEWIKCFLMNEYITIVDGKPVFHEYRDSVHASKEPLAPYKGLPLYIGLDFGLTPAAVFGQLTPKGQLIFIDEIVTENMGIQQMVREVLKPKLRNEYHDLKVIMTCDPAGTARSQTDEVSCLDILNREGFDVTPCDTNNFIARRESLAYFLTTLSDGKPAFQVSPKCDTIRRGLMGRYCYRRIKIAGNARYVEKPDKNMFSHVLDASMYLSRFLRESNSHATGGLGMGAPGSGRREVKPDDRFAGYV